MKRILIILVFLMSLAHAEEEKLHPILRDEARALVDSDGKKVDQERLAKPKYVMVYFSAHWCPPCRAFTPEFVKYYNENGGGKVFEVLFVSSDEDAPKMAAYMKEMQMPWIGLRFGSSKTGSLKKRYGGPGIPCLTVIDEKDEVVFHSYVDGKYIGPNNVLNQFTNLMKTAGNTEKK